MKNVLVGTMVAIALVAISACSKGGATSKYPATADGLKSLFTDLRAAALGHDNKTAGAMVKGLVPDEASVKKALKDDAGDTAQKMLEMYKQFVPKDDAEAAAIFAGQPERSVIAVHASTTEDLIAYKQGTPAFMEFPGGARAAAEQILRPGVTFYEVELLEPGHDMGMKYHLFFHDGTGWKMLGPVWRALR